MSEQSSGKLRFFLDPKVKALGIAFEAPRLNDAGFDIRSCEDMVVESGKQAVVATGLRLAIPPGWVGLIKDRSSMALKRVYTHAGVIDSDYRGELKIVLSNHANSSYHIETGAKIAQLVIVPCLTASEESQSLEALGSTERGEGGFGSTGK